MSELAEGAVQGVDDVDFFHPLRLYLKADLIAHLQSPKEASRGAAAAIQLLGRETGRCYLYGASKWPPVSRDVLRADCSSEPSDQRGIVQALFPPRPGQGDFAHSFPNVDDLAKHLTGLSLEDLQLFIAAEQKRSGEKVEILGAKLPQDAIAFWGIILLLVVTAYFWVVFREFAETSSGTIADCPVAWIGTSEDRVARIAFQLTLVVLCCTAGLLAWNGIGTAASMFARTSYVAAAVAIVVLVAMISYRHLTTAARRRSASADADTIQLT